MPTSDLATTAALRARSPGCVGLLLALLAALFTAAGYYLHAASH